MESNKGSILIGYSLAQKYYISREANGSGKRSSLLQYGNKFYGTGLRNLYVT